MLQAHSRRPATVTGLSEREPVLREQKPILLPCKIAAPVACLLANGFSPLPSGAGTAESKLWDCCTVHIDYLFAFPTRLRKLINFRWTKADSKPAEICNKSLK